MNSSALFVLFFTDVLFGAFRASRSRLAATGSEKRFCVLEGHRPLGISCLHLVNEVNNGTPWPRGVKYLDDPVEMDDGRS